MFFRDELLDAAFAAAETFAAKTANLPLVSIVGLPVAEGPAIYNAAAVVHGGKIAGIVRRLSSSGPASMEQLLENEPSLPDLVASFMGILELLKLRRILIDPDCDGTDGENAVHGLRTQFLINPDPPSADAGA
jgi:hypothetical protein